MNSEGTAFIRNQKCFIRKNHDCGRYFGASKTCFIACPDTKKIGLVLTVITNKLKNEKIEPFIAVKEKVYGEDIFCTKICGKIIESLFCMAILDDVEDNKGKISPNPNVFYEYGMMTSMNKEIIPLQKVDGKLAFNIQSIEIIKYTEENLEYEVEKAIRKTLSTIEKKHQFEESNSEYSHYIKKTNELLELMGFDKNYKYIESSWKLACSGTIFNPYMNNENVFFVGIVEKGVKINDILAEIRLLMSRLDKIALDYDDDIDNLTKKSEKIVTDSGKGSDGERQRTVAKLYGTKESTFDRMGEKYLEKIKRDLESNKWYRKIIDNVNIVIITSEESDRFLKLTESSNKVETKIKNISTQIWDKNRIEEFKIKLGLIIEN